MPSIHLYLPKKPVALHTDLDDYSLWWLQEQLHRSQQQEWWLILPDEYHYTVVLIPCFIMNSMFSDQHKDNATLQ
jgi:hypothetical protein